MAAIIWRMWPNRARCLAAVLVLFVAGGAGAQALPHATARNNAQLFTAAAERVTRLFKSPDRNHFCLATNAVTALYREQEAEVARAQHRG